MNKNKFLTIVSVGLLLINLLLVGFILNKEFGHSKHEGPRNLIIEKLKLDQDQVKNYDIMIANHRKNIGDAESRMFDLKKQLYSKLYTNGDIENRDSLLNELGKVQMKIEQINYSHFNELRKLCHPDQQALFQNLTNELTELFSKGPRRNKDK
jgi:hypothetical protein